MRRILLAYFPTQIKHIFKIIAWVKNVLPRHGTGRQTTEYPGGAHNNDLYTRSGMVTDFAVYAINY
jgi:hypothetical protein